MPPPLTISVVIPARNRARTIGYCLESVRAQTLPALEVIVVDDASADETADAAAQAGARVIRLPRAAGAQAARNAGIRAARGEWIAFQDSDDEWTPDKLQRQVAALPSGFAGPVLVHANALVIDEVSGISAPFEMPVEVEGPDAYAELLRSPAPLLPTILVPKLALESIGYLDEKVPALQEWDTAIRLARICRVVYVRDCLLRYHLHSGDTISKDAVRALDGYDYVMRKFESEIRQVCGVGAWDTHLMRQAVAAMEAALWRRADEYLAQLSHPTLHSRIIRLASTIHVRPSRLMSIRRMLYPKQRRPAPNSPGNAV